MNLAHSLRPQNLSEYFGQEELVGPGKIIRNMIEKDTLFSMILWGPPGSGKTTLASIISKESQADFHVLTGVTSGKEDLLKVIKTADLNKKVNKKTILFIDEIHRWNKAQQDTLLPFVESGLIILIGATTENPSFEVISALLSRCRVFVLHNLTLESLEKIIDRALIDTEKGLGKYKKKISTEAKSLLIQLSGGDARILLNVIDIAVQSYNKNEITHEIIKEIFQSHTTGIYDKKADEHYNLVSAFIKSMRGSQVDATLYYLARMLESGEDPKFIARRMIIFSSEDIGLADRGALIQANAGFEAVNKIGMPEAQLILAHIAIYLASAKKSRIVPNALERARNAVINYPNEPIPLHLRNAPTKLMKEIGYGKNYVWSDSFVGPKNELSYLPDKVKKIKIFEP